MDTAHDHLMNTGLDALSRSFVTPEVTFEQFMHGHVGASILAASFLLTDGLVEASAGTAILAMHEREYATSPLCRPMPPALSAPAALNRFLALLPRAFTDSCHVGHNVIYPTFALRAFHRNPELVTEERIDGICRIAEAFLPKERHVFPEPDPFEARAFSAWVLAAFLECVERYRGHGQGHAGHILTYGQSVQDLHALGHPDLARIAEAGFRDYVAVSLRGPEGWGPSAARVDPQPRALDPRQTRYWQDRATSTENAYFVHDTKYAYALIHHCRQAQDEALEARALAVYHLVAGF